MGKRVRKINSGGSLSPEGATRAPDQFNLSVINKLDLGISAPSAPLRRIILFTAEAQRGIKPQAFPCPASSRNLFCRPAIF